MLCWLRPHHPMVAPPATASPSPASHDPVMVDHAPVDVQVTVGLPKKPTLHDATHLSLTRLVGEQLKGLAFVATVVGFVVHAAASQKHRGMSEGTDQIRSASCRETLETGHYRGGYLTFVNTTHTQCVIASMSYRCHRISTV
jgi:hypothetical protein